MTHIAKIAGIALADIAKIAGQTVANIKRFGRPLVTPGAADRFGYYVSTQPLNPLRWPYVTTGFEENTHGYNNGFSSRMRSIAANNLWFKHATPTKTAQYRHFDCPASVQFLEDNWFALTGYDADDSVGGIFLHLNDDGLRYREGVTGGGFACFFLRFGHSKYHDILFGDEATPGYSSDLGGDSLVKQYYLWEDNVKGIVHDNGYFSTYNSTYSGDYAAYEYTTSADYEAAWVEYSRRWRIFADYFGLTIVVNRGASRSTYTADPIYGTPDLTVGWHDIIEHWHGHWGESTLGSGAAVFTPWQGNLYGSLRLLSKRISYILNDLGGYMLLTDSLPTTAFTITNSTGGTISYKVNGNVLTLTISGSPTDYDLTNASYDTITELVAVIEALTDITCSVSGCNPFTDTTPSALLLDVAATNITNGSTATLYYGQYPRDWLLTRYAAIYFVGVPGPDKVFIYGPVGTSGGQQDSDIADAVRYLGDSEGTSETFDAVEDTWATIPEQSGDVFYHEYSNGFALLNWDATPITVTAEDLGVEEFYQLRTNLFVPGVVWSSSESVTIPANHGAILFKTDINA